MPPGQGVWPLLSQGVKLPPPTCAPLESPWPFPPPRWPPATAAPSEPLLGRRRSPSVRVVLGAHRLQEPEESQQIFSVAESIAHPLYNPRATDNDIRLLQVSLHRAPSGRAVGYPTAPGCDREMGYPTALGCDREMGCPTALGCRRRWGVPQPWGTGRELGCPRPQGTRREVGCPTRGRADTRCQCFSGEAGPCRGV